MESLKIDRRDFIGKIGLGCAACLASMATSGCDSPVVDFDPIDGVTSNGNVVTIDLTAAGTSALNNEGGYLLIGNESVFMTRSDGVLRAMSSICPHEQFNMSKFVDGKIWCSNHDGRFGPDGTLISGKPRSSLTPYTVVVNGDIATVTKS